MYGTLKILNRKWNASSNAHHQLHVPDTKLPGLPKGMSIFSERDLWIKRLLGNSPSSFQCLSTTVSTAWCMQRAMGWRRILALVHRAYPTIGQWCSFKLNQYFFLSGISLVWAKGPLNTTSIKPTSPFLFPPLRNTTWKWWKPQISLSLSPALHVNPSQEALSFSLELPSQYQRLTSF